MTSQLDLLTRINLDDLVDSFGWQNHPLPARLLQRVFYKTARDFARLMVGFDTAVGAHGLAEGARWTLRPYARSLRVYGRDLLPAGPFLALSNHPGMTDTLTLFAALDRKDLKIIALDRPFLNALTNTSKQLFYVKDDAASRMGLVRQVSGHLRAGGAALTFPGGHIEPDPDVHDGAVESLKDWTDSAAVFVRMAPETPVIPVLVRGVVRRNSARHPLLVVKRTKEEKGKLAAALQLLAHVTFHRNDVDIRVQIGKPITARDLGTTEAQVIHQAVLAEMTRLIQNPPEGEGVNAL
ncbi:MAG: lysophospholipid acyltransferase family protein [Chloroflexota bacterium]